MVEVKRIKSPSDIPAAGNYVLVLYGPSAMDREHPRGRTLMVRDGKRDRVKLDEFAAAVETAKTLAETKHFQIVYVIDEVDAKRTIGQLRWFHHGINSNKVFGTHSGADKEDRAATAWSGRQINVCFGAHNGLKNGIAPCPKSAKRRHDAPKRPPTD
jgi:hypothetical protein